MKKDNPDMEGVLRRIRKMLAMADGNANANESATAAAMAEKLMRKFNLEHADVLLDELDDDSIVDYETNISYTLRSRVPTFIATIVVATAQLHDCEARYNVGEKEYRGRMKLVQIVTFLGEKSDVIVAAWVFEYLIKEIRRHMRNYAKETGCNDRGKDAFQKACAREVASTLYRMTAEKEAEVQKHSTGTSLVLRKRDLVAQKFDVKYSKPKRESHSDPDAHYAGLEAGRSISIRQGVEQTGGKQTQLK